MCQRSEFGILDLQASSSFPAKASSPSKVSCRSYKISQTTNNQVLKSMLQGGDPKQAKFDSCKQFTWSEWERTVCWEFRRLKQIEQRTLGSKFFERDTLRRLNIMKSKQLYKILNRMPKGVLHHNHIDSMEDLEFIKKYVVDRPGVYLNDTMTSWQYGTPEEAVQNKWITTTQARKRCETNEQFEKALLNVTQFLPELATEYSHDEYVWPFLEKKIKAFLPLFEQKDIFRDYLKHVCESYLQGGYYRLELKISLKRRNPTFEEFVSITEQVEQLIKVKYPFFSIGLIPFGLRDFSGKELEDCLRMVYKLQSHLIVGIDLANQQDSHAEFAKHASIIKKVQEQFKERSQQIKGVFSAGETRKMTNHNIAKVMECGSVRIGHALNLFQHSYLIPIIQQRNICIETCPLSSQYLGYVYNLLQHPAVGFYNLGIPISISSNDPSRFGYTGVTPDYFVATHAFGFDLKDMKLLAIYSILHALASTEEKAALLVRFEEDWKVFMKSVEAEFGL